MGKSLKLAEKQKILDSSKDEAVAWAAEKYGEKLTLLAVAHLNEIQARLWLWKSYSALEKRKGESRSWNIAKGIFDMTIRLTQRGFAKAKRRK